jgi:hypothetical protein
VFLARGVNAGKWKKRKIGQVFRVPAEGLTKDFRVEEDCLSFWTCDPTQPSSLDDVVLAVAVTRQTVDRLDLVWLEEEAIIATRAKVVETLGETPARTVRDRHRDVANFGLTGVSKLAHAVAKAVNGTQTKRWTKKQVLEIIDNAVRNNALDLDGLSADIKEKISVP